MILSELTQDGAMLTLIIALVGMSEVYVPNKKYLPLTSLVLGIGVSILVNGISVDSGVIGLVMGLSACGLYDQKNIITK